MYSSRGRSQRKPKKNSCGIFFGLSFFVIVFLIGIVMLAFNLEGGQNPVNLPLPGTPTAIPASENAAPTEIVPTPASTPQPGLTEEPVYLEVISGERNRDDLPDNDVIDSSASPTPGTRLPPEQWQRYPVVPAVSESTRRIYRYGLEVNDPNAFSVVGDCLSYPYLFMSIYDSDRYRLSANYTYLEETIRHFQGSFSRQGQAVTNGMNPAAALSPSWSDQEVCEANESPLACELRIQRPVIVFINLGTNWAIDSNNQSYETYLRQMVDIIIKHGAVPILSTKADNAEGNSSINLATARVAYEYDLPLWNFWASVQDLTDSGLDIDRDMIYLTDEGYGWHGFTALQALDAVWKGVR